MTPKAKLIMKFLFVAMSHRKAWKLAKKINRFNDEERYSAEYRNGYILKVAKKFKKILNIDLEVIGYENIPKNPVVLAPNHTSGFDPALIVMALENPEKGPDHKNHLSVFLAKQEVLEDKRSRGYAEVHNSFYINRKKPKTAIRVLEDIAGHAKANKKHIVIFPEGTRSKNGEVQEFRGGAFKIAKQSFLPIIPVTINNALSITDFSRKGRLKVQVVFHKPIKPMSFMTSDTKSIASRVQKIVKSDWVKPEGKRAEKEYKLA